MSHEEFSREELVRHIGGLNAEIQGLTRQLGEAEWVEGALKQRTRLLNERVKELACAYEALRLVRRQGLSAREKVQTILELLPKAWQHAGSACARAVLHDHEFRTRNFAESPWTQSEPVLVRGRAVGTVEVRYRVRQPEQDEGPFLREERALLSVIAECLGLVLESQPL